ncbi:MAG: 6-carboxytetrahydropterin synthase [Planctomycetaceae bacterium]|jgi:6-pyruvoyltetrahydropterin/6-carboxytetrahydropterin synthase|nr:6-carboxytetrahydropterin synthase [Planctomycetaceae bacterium]
MFTISREFTFCYGHRLQNHSGKCAHPHGHNARVRIVLESDCLNEQGMVFDFTEQKRTIGQWIENHLDHRMILQNNDPLVEILEQMNEPIFLLPQQPTAENIARLLFEKTEEFGFPVQSVTFWETDQCSAEYRKITPKNF